MQDHGDWPAPHRLDLWGSATMRTGGDDLAQALALLGVRPVWDARVGPRLGLRDPARASFGRPRVDVTLRISGLFRDVFPTQIALFDEAVRAVAALDEDAHDNPLAAARARGEATITAFSAQRPGAYGIGIGRTLPSGDWTERDELGEAYLAASCYAYGRDDEGVDAARGLPQPRRERRTPSCMCRTWRSRTCSTATPSPSMRAALRRPPRARREAGALSCRHARAGVTACARLAEEIARVLRGRAANPRWIAGPDAPRPSRRGAKSPRRSTTSSPGRH